MKLYTLEEASKIMRVGKTRLYSLLNNNQISGVKVGDNTLITDIAIDKWMEELPPYIPKN